MRSTRNTSGPDDTAPAQTLIAQGQSRNNAFIGIAAADNNNDDDNTRPKHIINTATATAASNKKGPKPLTGDAADERGAVDLFGAWYLDDGARLYGLKPKPGDIERVWQYMLPPRAPSPSAKWCRAYWMRQEAANVAARWGDAKVVAAQNVRKTIDGLYASLDDVVRQITRTGKDARGHHILVMVTHALEEAGWRFVLRRTQSNARERVVPLDSIDVLVNALAVILVDEPEIDAVQRYLGSAAHGSLAGWGAMIEARKQRQSPALSTTTSSPMFFSSTSTPLPTPSVSSLASPHPNPVASSQLDRAALSMPTIAAYPARTSVSRTAVHDRVRIDKHTPCGAPALQGTRGASLHIEPLPSCVSAGDVATSGGHAHNPICVDGMDTPAPFGLDLNNPPDDADDAAWAAIAAAQNNRKRHFDSAQLDRDAAPTGDVTLAKRPRSTPHDTASTPSNVPADHDLPHAGDGATGSIGQSDHHTSTSNNECQDACGGDDQETDDEALDHETTVDNDGANLANNDEETDDEEQDTATRPRIETLAADATLDLMATIQDQNNYQGSPGDDTSQSSDDKHTDHMPLKDWIAWRYCRLSTESHGSDQKAQRYRRNIHDALYRIPPSHASTWSGNQVP
nr:hypothetical protein [Pandoravirus aubagnensis]